MGSPGIKEDPCCAVASAKGLVWAGLLRGGPSSSGPQGERVLGRGQRVRANGRDQSEPGRKSDAPSEGPDGGYMDMQPQ